MTDPALSPVQRFTRIVVLISSNPSSPGLYTWECVTFWE